MKINFSNSRSKVKTLTDSIGEMVNNGVLKIGDDLPSINEMSRRYTISRDTVFKAYSELKNRGIIDSTTTKGYFVKGEMNNVLLLLDTYSIFKEILYNRFIEKLGTEKFRVDVLFHQYNRPLYDKVISDSIGRYNYYIVMNFDYNKPTKNLRKIPQNRLLMLDYGGFSPDGVSYILQDFTDSLKVALAQALPLLKKYDSIELFFHGKVVHPEVSIRVIRQFCAENRLKCSVVGSKPSPESIRSGVAYVTFNQSDMVQVISGCNSGGFVLGEDVGLLAYNDIPLNEIIKEGISAISVDFGSMGEMAANFILNNREVGKVLAVKFIRRNSL